MIQVDRIISLWAHSDLVPVKPILDPSEIERLSNVGLAISCPAWTGMWTVFSNKLRLNDLSKKQSLKNVVITFYDHGERSEGGEDN